MADLLTRTARQVRTGRDGSTVHMLRGEPYTTPQGRQYRTVCDKTLLAYEGAILTTREAGCTACLSGGVSVLRGDLHA